MIRTLILGCGNPDHPHRHRIVLPVRADAFANNVKNWRCPVQMFKATKDDDGRCHNAIMVIGVEEQPDEPKASTPTRVPGQCADCKTRDHCARMGCWG